MPGDGDVDVDTEQAGEQPALFELVHAVSTTAVMMAATALIAVKSLRALYVWRVALRMACGG